MRNARLLLCALCAWVAAGAQAGSDAHAWFERMREALHGQDYEGRFVYQVGPQLEAMYVVHRVSGAVELERLVSLNGDHKQVIRGDQAVACLEPGKHRISVIEGLGGDSRRSTALLDSAQLLNHYQMAMGERQRIAGREAQLIRIIPRDGFRFGYDLYLDSATALPLRTVMLDRDGQQQSQMMFVELKTGKDITPIEHDVSALQLARPERITVAAGVSDPTSSGWRFATLPPGFVLHSYRADSKRRHFIFSDGLATLSLYIEPAAEGGLGGFSSVGATWAYGAQRHGRQITAVGEVPRETLRLIAHAVEPH
jgi:sigma-E factor negative regulatory protein RseB